MTDQKVVENHLFKAEENAETFMMRNYQKFNSHKNEVQDDLQCPVVADRCVTYNCASWCPSRVQSSSVGVVNGISAIVGIHT